MARPDELVEPPVSEAELELMNNSTRGLGHALLFGLLITIGGLLWCWWKFSKASAP